MISASLAVWFMSSRITSRRVPGAVASAVALRLPWAVAEDVAGPGLGVTVTVTVVRVRVRLRWLANPNPNPNLNPNPNPNPNQVDPTVFARRLWGDVYFQPRTRGFKRKPPDGGGPRTFV